ncbi:MAG: DUF4760 domain-containing protein [Janthinobacterium lividum]
MAWASNPPTNPKKPSRVLGFLLAAVLLTTIVFSLSELAGHQRFILEEPPAGLEKSQWVVLLGVVAAVAGWIISAIVTMRNSIRQHTVTTLLSSRLSETYMSQTRLVNARYFSPSGGLYRLTPAEVAVPSAEAQIAALRYLLNYFEFIAVGIRYGDLDEKLLKNTLRGILCGVYEAAGPLVSQRRQAPDGSTAAKSKTFEHLEWLYGRWFIAALQRREENRTGSA